MKTQWMRGLAALASAVLIASCGAAGGGGGGGEPTPPPSGKPSSVVLATTIPPDADCPAGGILVESGIDDNGNGVLDASEVDTTQKVCNGTGGLPLLAKTTVIAPGDATCPAGGVKIEAGLDADGDGILDPGEVNSTFTQSICNGVSGNNGNNGLASLVKTTVLAAGDPCLAGGVKIETGLDANGNGTLDSGEVNPLLTQTICNGVTGNTGDTGLTTLVKTTVLAPPSPCPTGGVKIEVGVDSDSSGTLEPEEVNQPLTQTICNGVTGNTGDTGLTTLVKTTVLDPPSPCPTGGVKIEVGVDSDSSGTLATEEVNVLLTQTICNGVAGEPGADGHSALMVITEVPPTDLVHCPLGGGGSKVEVGLDNGDGETTPDDGILQPAEVDQTSYICNGASPSGSLLAADLNGDLYTVSLEDGTATLALPTCEACRVPIVNKAGLPGAPLPQDTEIGGVGIGEISAMVYRPQDHTLYAGTGGESECNGCVFTINPVTGGAKWLSDLSDAIPGMAIRADGTMFAAYNVTALFKLNTIAPTGTGATIGSLEPDGLGNGMTFDASGWNLYLADDTGLYQLDQLDGERKFRLELTYTGFEGLIDPVINSMTVDPRTGQAYAIVKEPPSYAFLAGIDLGTGEVTPIGRTTDNLDGLTFFPGTLGVIPTYDVTVPTFAPVAPVPGPDFAHVVVLGDEQLSTEQPIGFNFKFFGKTYTGFYICSNGWIAFQRNTGGCFGGAQDIPKQDDDSNLIAMAWAELNPGSGGTISYDTIGTAPSRKLVVNFRQVDFFNEPGLTVTVQAILYETSNVVEIHATQLLGGHQYTQGLENAYGTVASFPAGRVLFVPSTALNNDAVSFTPNP